MRFISQKTVLFALLCTAKQQKALTIKNDLILAL